VSTFGWKSNEWFKFIAADAGERGACLVGTQHGAGTGTSVYSPMDEFIQQEMDFYVTIGQLKDEVPRAVPLPSPNFQRLRREKLVAKNKESDPGIILFVGNSYPRYATSFRSQPISSQMVAYMDWRARFFCLLPVEMRRKTLVRLYPVDYGWKNKLRLGEKYTDLGFDDFSVGIFQRMEKCRLLVTDNPQTTFLESLVSNVPTILFFDPTLWQMAHRAKGAFDRFREAGIVHYDPESAAVFMKEIETDVLGWWEKDSVKEARRNFLNWQVIEETDWVVAWKTALLDWSRSSTRPGAAMQETEHPEEKSQMAETGQVS
jgi:putative transferase (TIGR04331 family)